MRKRHHDFPAHVQERITAALKKRHEAGMPLTQKQADGTYLKIYPDGRREVLDMDARRAAIEEMRSS